MRIMSVVGARPNFIKIAPFCHAVAEYNMSSCHKIEHVLVHTGQHYDDRMSKAFFSSLNIPLPDLNLNVGSGTHAEQVGLTMVAFEKVLKEYCPDLVVVVGDVNAVCACAITTKKENILLAHIEAGLRSRDMSMPEEVNRLVADRLADLLLVPDRISYDNLIQEGIPRERIKFVGNIMIDSLENMRRQAGKLDINDIIKNNMFYRQSIPEDIDRLHYGLFTMHRPSNVDNKDILSSIINFMLKEVVTELPVVCPLHPRTEKHLKEFDLLQQVIDSPGLILLGPIKYEELLRLNIGADIMFTDSGGLQEECCVLGTPCLTMRDNTERPVTLVEHGGTSVLVGNDISRIRQGFKKQLNHKVVSDIPEMWDGHTAQRIVAEIVEFLT